jgi:hypothetical protein
MPNRAFRYQRKLMRKTWLIIALSACSLFTGSLEASCCWYPYVEGAGWAGNWWEGGGGRLFVPLWQGERALTFAEADFFEFRRETAFSVGGGYRRLFRRNLALGLGGMFDYAHFRRHHSRSIYQGMIFGEALWRCWELRIDGYLPRRNVTEQATISPLVGTINGTQLLATSSRTAFSQHPYSGFDLLVGYNFEPCRTARLRGWAGYFYYCAHHAHTLQGPRLQIQGELDNLFGWCGTRLILGGIWQWDHRCKSRGSGIFGIRIPLGRCAPCCCPSICRRMGDPIFRRPGILVRERSEFVVTTLTGQIIFFEQGGTGTGTQTDPTNLANALAMAGPGTVLFGLNTKGAVQVSSVPGQTIILKNFQQLLSFGDPSMTKTFSALGTTFTVADLTNTGQLLLLLPSGASTNMIQLANNNILDGFTVGGLSSQDGGQNSIFGTTSVSLVIRNVGVFNSVQDGVLITTEAPNVSITNSSFEDVGGTGIVLTNATNSVIDTVLVSKPGTMGILYAGNTTGATINNTRVNVLRSDVVNVVFDNATNVSITNSSLSNEGGGSGAALLSIGGAGNYTVSDLTAAMGATGAQFPIMLTAVDPVGPINLSGLIMENAEGASPATGAAVLISVTGWDQALQHMIVNNLISKPGGNGILIQLDTTTADTWTLMTNTVTGTGPTDFAGDGLAISRTATAAGTTTTVRMNVNTIDQPSNGISIIDLGPAADDLFVTVTNNEVMNSRGNGSYFFVSHNGPSAVSNFNLLVLNNQASGSSEGFVFELNSPNGNGCITLLNNSASNTVGIELSNNTLGTFNATNGTAAGLAAANPGVSGSIVFSGGEGMPTPISTVCPSS